MSNVRPQKKKYLETRWKKEQWINLKKKAASWINNERNVAPPSLVMLYMGPDGHVQVKAAKHMKSFATPALKKQFQQIALSRPYNAHQHEAPPPTTRQVRQPLILPSRVVAEYGSVAATKVVTRLTEYYGITKYSQDVRPEWWPVSVPFQSPNNTSRAGPRLLVKHLRAILSSYMQKCPDDYTVAEPLSKMTTQTAPIPDPQMTTQTAPILDPQMTTRTAPILDPQMTTQTAPVPDPQMTTQTAPIPDPQMTTRPARIPDPQMTNQPVQPAPVSPQISSRPAPVALPQVLSTENRKKKSRIMSYIDMNDDAMVVTAYRGNVGNRSLTCNDLRSCTHNGEWVTDDIMDAYTMNNIVNNMGISYLSCAKVEDSFVRDLPLDLQLDCGGRRVLFYRNIDNNHWILLMADIQNKTLIIMDPLGTCEREHAANRILQTWRRAIGSTDLQWSYCTVDHPPQRDNSSCGIFCLIIAKRVVMRMSEDLMFSGIDVAAARNHIFTSLLPILDESLLSSTCRYCCRPQLSPNEKWIECGTCMAFTAHYNCLRIKDSFVRTGTWICPLCM